MFVVGQWHAPLLCMHEAARAGLNVGAWHLEMPARFICVSASLSIETREIPSVPRGRGGGSGQKEVRQHLLGVMDGLYPL